MKAWPLSVPDPALQQTLVRAGEEASEARAGLVHQATDWRRRSLALRRALLTAAFTGRLTGRSSDMDVAEELAEVAS